MTTDEGDARDAAARPGDDRPVPRLLCEPFVLELPVAGASVSVFDAAGRQSTICASDIVAARLDELQLELGEGPQWDALRTARTVLVPELSDDATASWPVFTSAARELGVRALFVFPMFLGAVTVGVVGLHSAMASKWDASQIATAVRLTHGITRRAVQQALHGAEDDGLAEAAAAPAMRREMHQATGMILAQLDVSATEAFFRLRAYAFSNSRTVQEVARAVVSREIDFRDIPD